ncbi:MAG: FGGY family carbohydrate kinase [Clostridiaceae bacterium]
MPYFIAIDLGTTGCRSIVFDEQLHCLASSYREYGLITPREKWVEQDAELWWRLTQQTVRDALRESAVDTDQIGGIAVSSQGITIMPVDKQLSPLQNAISWLDVRAEEQAEWLRRDFGNREIFTLTGKQINAAYSLPKILWLKKHKTTVFSSTWKFLMPLDFITGKLTGNCVTDHTMASGTLLYDMKAKTWSSRILQQYELSADQLPVLKWSGEIAGTLTAEAAEALHLREGCPVAVGAQDQRCASLSVGLRPGVMSISLGTSGAICKYWDAPHTEGDMRIGWSAYINENSWVTEGVINTAAASLRWLRDTMFPGMEYEGIDTEAEAAQNRGSCLLFYPYLNGPSSPDNYPESTGCFHGVSLSTQRGDFALAVLEGVAFQIRIMLEAMQAYENVHTLVLFGGGAKSTLWAQIIADITGICIEVPETAEAAGAGAAILAGIAAGTFDRNNTPVLRHNRSYQPSGRQAAYEAKFQTYRQLEKKLWH